MRRVLMAAVAAAAIGIATPAAATGSFADLTGPDLNTKIYASHDDPSVAPNSGTLVYGNTSTGAGHDTAFYGYSAYNIIAGTGTATSIDITDGGGFAQITDTDFESNPNGDHSVNNVFDIIMDPVPAFTAYEFSIQLDLKGNDTSHLYIYYVLTGGSSWIQALPLVGLLTGGSDNQFILNGLDPGQSFDKILIAADAPIYKLKQNSIDVVGYTPPVPEPRSWALMLLGFGGMGLALRRSRRKQPLMQIA